MQNNELETKSIEIKRLIVETVTKAKGGHIGTSLSETDILTALYFHILNIDSTNFKNPDRDRFVLSKGHGSEGLYCTLAAKGIFPEANLAKYLTHESELTIHPTNHINGVEVNTGALGHGFSNAVGMALAAKKSGRKYRTFVLTGDGELQEGSNWEAAMSAAHFNLGNLTVIVDNNGLQLADRIEKTMRIEPLGEKFKAFGFDVHYVDGHSMPELTKTLDNLDYSGDKPHAIIARTTKGKGVSFMENIAEWHHRVPTPAEAEIALKELKI
jgi:transketolase